MKLSRRPDPPPLETDDVRVVLVLTTGWALALLVLTLRAAAGGRVHTWWFILCVCGLALGLVGVAYCRRRRGPLHPAS